MSGRRDSAVHAPRHLEAVGSGPEHRPSIASVAIWPWVEAARRHELAIEHVASHAHVEVAALRDPGARFSQVVANRIVEFVAQRVGSGASMAATLTVEAGHLGLLEVMARTAPTVGDAMALGCQFFSLLHADVRLAHEIRADGAHVMRIVSPPNYPIHPGFYEFTFGAWIVALRRESDHATFAPSEVWFRHRAPADRSVFDEVLGSSVRFDMPEYHMVLDRAFAALPLARRNATVHADAVKAAGELLRSRD